MLDGGGLDWCVARTRASSEHLYGWAESTAYATPFVADPAKRSLVVGTIDFDESSTRRRSPRRCARTGSSTSSPTASSGATSCAIGMFPAIDTADVQALTACIDWVVERLA